MLGARHDRFRSHLDGRRRRGVAGSWLSRLLVGYDGSDAAGAAAAFGLAMASKPGCRTTLVAGALIGAARERRPTSCSSAHTAAGACAAR
jgi:hypothetical protein